MNTIPTLAVTHGKITTTSNQIAEHFNKRHDRVLRAIANLECSPEFRLTNFGETDYIDKNGDTQPSFILTRDGFTFLAMGFTGKDAAQWKESYIAAFNQMEAALLAAPVTPVLLTGKKHIDLYFSALRAYTHNSDGMTWIAITERMFHRLGIKTLKEITADNIEQAIRFIAGEDRQPLLK